MPTVVGVGLGILAGWFRDVEAALEPFIWFKYSAPTVAFYPLFVAWLGYGTPTIIAIAFLFALTPIYANTLSGIKNVDHDLVTAARSFGARPLRYLPAGGLAGFGAGHHRRPAPRRRACA